MMASILSQHPSVCSAGKSFLRGCRCVFSWGEARADALIPTGGRKVGRKNFRAFAPQAEGPEHASPQLLGRIAWTKPSCAWRFPAMTSGVHGAIPHNG